MVDSACLVFPPGWSLDIAGPHLSLPALEGFCARKEAPVAVRDFNIEVSTHLGARITAREAVEAATDGSFDALNTPYSAAQSKLDAAAARFNGSWCLREGFRPTGYSPSSSEDVRRATAAEYPFSSFARQTLIPELIQYDLVGLSIAVPGQLFSAFHLAHLLREADYSGRVLLGGNTVTRLGSALSRDWVFDLVDGIVLFGGELAISSILRHPDSWPNGVPNLMWRAGREVILNPRDDLTPNQFAQPTYESLDLANYWGVVYLPAVGFRGCYYGRCPFCAIPYAWGSRGVLGMSSPSSVLDSLTSAVDTTGISHFKFVDEAIHPQFLRQFAALVGTQGLKIDFEAYARLDPFLLDGALMKQAAAAGLRKLYIGLELASDGNRNLLGKSDTARPGEVLTHLSDLGIEAHLFCMFGYPGTTADDAARTLEFLLSNSSMIDTVDIAPFRLERHTSVPGATPVPSPGQDWALSYAYSLAENSSSISPDDVAQLCGEVEDLLWMEQPTWLHPTYRLASPWYAKGPSSVRHVEGRAPHPVGV